MADTPIPVMRLTFYKNEKWEMGRHQILENPAFSWKIAAKEPPLLTPYHMKKLPQSHGYNPLQSKPTLALEYVIS